MHDYWNDPPEPQDPPSPDCPNHPCDGTGEYLYDGKTGWVFSCDTCAYQWVVKYPPEPEPPEDIPIQDNIEPVEGPKECPHGMAWEDCDACMHASDIAYDAQREQRHR